MSLDSCRLCGGDALSLLYTQGLDGRFRFYRCRSCGYVNYDLSTGLDQSKYSSGLPDPTSAQGASNRSQTATFGYIRRRIPFTGSLIDIGCGNGRLLHLAIEAGWRAEGLETSSGLAARAASGTGAVVHVGTLPGGLPELAGGYDLVVLRHVLEHIPDPVGAVLEIGTLLSERGLLLFEFPDIDSPEARLKRVSGRLGIRRKAWRPDYVPGHCGEFCRRSFRRLLDIAGMELLHWETYSVHPLKNAIFRVLPAGGKARALVRRRHP